MKVLLLGGTGAMGAHLASQLNLCGVDIAVTTRSERKNGEGVRYLRGDAKDPVFLRSVLSEHWDAIVDFMVYGTNAFTQRINRLLESTSQYLFLSSARVYANSSNPLTEQSPRLLDASQDAAYLATDEYALAKARQEDVLFNSSQRNWTIIRPYITYSEARMQLGVLEKEAWLYRALRSRTIVFSADIAPKLTTLTYGSDVARGIRALINCPSALGEAFHITARDSISWSRVLDIFLDTLETHLRNRPSVQIIDTPRFEKVHPIIHQIRYDRLYNRQFNNDKIGRIIDLSSFVPPETGLRMCLRRFLEDPRFLDINWKFEAMKDVICGERTPLVQIPGTWQKMTYLLHRKKT